MRLRSLLLAVAVSALGASSATAASLTPPSVRIDAAAAGDLAGTSVAAAGDVNGDGHGDLVVGTPGAGRGADGAAAGAAWIVFGPFAPGTTIDLASPSTPAIRLSGSGAQDAGRSVAGAGDVNGDGLADVIVGAPAATPGQEGPQGGRRGHAYVVFGSRTPHSIDLSHLGTQGIDLVGTKHYFPDAFGWRVAPLGDVDRDGHADVAVAAPGNSGFEGDFTRGAAYVVFGRKAGGTVRVARAGRGAYRVGPVTPGALTAISDAGDWNGDHRRDLALVDPYAVGGRGALYVVYGRRRATGVDLRRLGCDGVLVKGHYLHFRMGGATLAGGRDVDGDGLPDVVLGEPGAHSSALAPPAGSVWVVRGSRSRKTIDLQRPGRRAWELAWGARGSMTGAASGLGRLGGDRRPDIVTVSGRSVLVLYGTASRTTVKPATPVPPARGFTIDGLPLEPPLPPTPLMPNTDTGGFTTAAVAGDLNGDGRDDLLAGAPTASHEGRVRAGSAYLFFTPAASIARPVA